MSKTVEEILQERLEEELSICFCEFEPQSENNTRCAVCNERKWDVHHVALGVVSKLLIEAKIEELSKFDIHSPGVSQVNYGDIGKRVIELQQNLKGDTHE